MAASLNVTMVLSAGEGTSTPVRARGWVHQSSLDGSTTRQVTVYVNELDLTLQGPAADMFALVDRIRDAMVAEVGRAWPVEALPTPSTIDKEGVTS